MGCESCTVLRLRLMRKLEMPPNVSSNRRTAEITIFCCWKFKTRFGSLHQNKYWGRSYLEKNSVPTGLAPFWTNNRQDPVSLWASNLKLVFNCQKPFLENYLFLQPMPQQNDRIKHNFVKPTFCCLLVPGYILLKIFLINKTRQKKSCTQVKNIPDKCLKTTLLLKRNLKFGFI